uniref:Uncharacterized protein n=1 Tax=Vespula pensylvanica TaxID=30213 RepID=A0A834KMI9_VESPE|nr:hypothetical protein H0235_014397 [Vespula pensylvanica]
MGGGSNVDSEVETICSATLITAGATSKRRWDTKKGSVRRHTKGVLRMDDFYFTFRSVCVDTKKNFEKEEKKRKKRQRYRVNR